jgi:hypothetical protein
MLEPGEFERIIVENRKACLELWRTDPLNFVNSTAGTQNDERCFVFASGAAK